MYCDGDSATMKVLNAQSGHNTAGTPLSHNGYVICQVCGKDVQEISKETAPRFAYCLKCRPNTHQEVSMPAAPKPSHAETTPARARSPRKRVGVVAKPKVKKVIRVNTSRHAPPQ